MQTDIKNLSDFSWVTNKIDAVTTELSDATTALNNAQTLFDSSTDDYDRALQEVQIGLSQAEIDRLQNGIRSRYAASLATATADCVAATSFAQGF